MRNVLPFLLALALAATTAFACPTCGKAKEVLPPSAEPSGLAGGFDASIYVLLGTVIVAMGFLGWTIFRSSGRPSAAQARIARPSPPAENHS